MKKTETETQLQVLALVARGDTYEQISGQTGLAIATIADIKKRNPSVLETIQNQLVQHKITTSKKILSKAQGLIEKKLDRADSSETQRVSALERFKSGEISYEEYQKETFGLAEVSLSELNSVAKEAFTQSQIQDGKPTSINSSPHEAKQELMALVEAIKSGDEVILERLVFSPNETIRGEL